MWEKKRANLLRDAERIIDAAKSANRNLTADEKARLDGITAEVKSGDNHQARASEDGALLSSLKAMGANHDPLGGSGFAAKGNGGRLATWPAASRQLAGNLATKSAELAGIVNAGVGMGGTKSLLPVAGSVTDSVTVLPGIAQAPTIPMSFLELLPTVEVDLPNYAYLRQAMRDNKAAPVAPGEVKPTSQYGLERVEGVLKVIAHLTEPVGKYDLLDITSLTQFLDAELRYGLFTAIEAQALKGDGAGVNLAGLLGTSGAQVQPFADDLLTTARKAVTALENIGHQPTALVLRPEDWEALELTKASGSGEFTLASSPVDRAARRVWGVQVVVSTQLPAGKAVMLDTSTLAIYSDRQGVSVEWSTSGDDFERNQVRARCEGRFGLAVYQPTGTVIVSTAAAGA